MCLVEQYRQCECSDKTHCYGKDCVQKARRIEREKWQQELGRHREDGMEDVDGEGVAADEARHLKRLPMNKSEHRRHKTEEASRQRHNGEEAPVTPVGIALLKLSNKCSPLEKKAADEHRLSLFLRTATSVVAHNQSWRCGLSAGGRY